MDIGIIGSGQVGKALGAGFIARGDRVTIGSREPGRQDLLDWQAENGESALLGSDFDAASFGELLIFAVKWTGAREAFELAGGAENFAGKVVIDTLNPIGQDAEGGMILSVGPDTSASETLQSWAPDAKVVKALNYVGYRSMVGPQFEGGPASAFFCSDHDDAKAVAADVLQSFGWIPVDMGALRWARALEPMVLLWMDYGMNHGTWDHAFKLVRWTTS